VKLKSDNFLRNIPSNWKYDRLKDVVMLRNDRSNEASETEDYLELEDIESGTGRILNRRNTMEVESNVTLFKQGDILFGKLRPYLEKYYHADFDGKCTGEILAFKPERIYGRFLLYCIASSWFIERCNMLAYGAKMPRVNWPTQLAQINLPIPPFPEQQRIAGFLDASCQAIDAAVEAKRKQIDTLVSLRKSTILHAVTKGLKIDVERRDSCVDWFGKIPKHWNCEHLKRFTTRIQTGMTPPTSNNDFYDDGSIPWFAPGSYNGEIELKEPRKLINELARKEGKLRMFPINTVFLIGIGATIGKVGLVPMEASCNQQLIGIVCSHLMNSRYLTYQFKLYENVISGIAPFTTLPIFDQVKTAYLPTLQPPLEEQVAICDFLDNKLSEIVRIIDRIKSQIVILSNYRKSLIHECVTGKRRVTEEDLNRVEKHGEE